MKIIYIIISMQLFMNSLALGQTYVPAERVYKRTSDYVADAFNGDIPKKETVWVIGGLRGNINDVLNGVENAPVRYRYWKKDNKTVWVLESVAKTMPITAGVTVKDGHIEDISVLTYRETRGFEVQGRHHRVQYYGATLDQNNQLDKPIDGISGSTLSVNSMKRMARIAILLHNDVMDN